MNQPKRYHPLLLLFNLLNLIINTSVFAIFLFVIKADSQSTLITYGRVAFIITFGLTLISMIWKWFTHKYKLDDRFFHLYKGMFSKSERTIPFAKIHNVNRHTSVFHRIFNVTSISFETGMKGDDDAVKFEVITLAAAENMEAHVTNSNHDKAPSKEEREDSNRTLHFKTTKSDIMKASITSLSFLFLIPFIGSTYFKMDELFHIEDAEGIFTSIIGSWWIVSIIIILLIIASAIFGVVRTYLKYGNYEISSDRNSIYIKKGIVDETTFSITKEKIQAIEIKQTTLKKMLGVAEVKLTSAGGLSIGEDSLEVNSLYPFLPVIRAYEMISEILPSYKVTQNMKRLPKKSFWVRMFRPSWLWIISTLVLYYFKPSILKIDQAWWILSGILLILITGLRWLSFLNTRYVLNECFIQIKKGSLITSLFVSKRTKIIEVQVTRNLFQQRFGLASIGTINRAKPLLHAGVDDVPLELADSFYTWYRGRNDEVEVE